MAAVCPTFVSSPPLPPRSPARPPTRKVAVIETTASVEEIAEEEQTIGRLTSKGYNQDF